MLNLKSVLKIIIHSFLVNREKIIMKKSMGLLGNWMERVKLIPVKVVVWTTMVGFMLESTLMRAAFADTAAVASNGGSFGANGAITGNVKGIFTGFTQIAYYGSLFGSIVLGILGILQIISANKKGAGESIKPGVLMLLGAGMLGAIVVLILSISGSLFGSSGTQSTSLNSLLGTSQ